MNLTNALEVQPQHLQNCLLLHPASGKLIPVYYDSVSTILQHGHFWIGHYSEFPDVSMLNEGIYPVWKHKHGKENLMYITLDEVLHQSQTSMCLNGGGQ